MLPAGGGPSRQIATARGLLKILNRVAGQLSIPLTRLRRTARVSFALSVRQRPMGWSITPTREPHLSTRAIYTQRPSVYSTHRYSPVPVLSGAIYRARAPLSKRDEFPVLLSLLPKRQRMPGSSIPTRLPRAEGHGNHGAGAIVHLESEHGQARATGPFLSVADTEQAPSRSMGVSPTHPSISSPYRVRRLSTPSYAPASIEHGTHYWITDDTTTHPERSAIAPPFAVRPRTARNFTSSAMSKQTCSSRNTGEQRSNTGRGDLFIDGFMLGRWLTQHLSREIAGPPTGAIGVDPRINPTWCGPPVAM